MPENNKKQEIKGYSVKIPKKEGVNLAKKDLDDKDNVKFRFDKDGLKSIKDIVSAMKYDGLKPVKDIVTITEYYALNDSTIAPPDDSAFSTTVIAPTRASKHLWSYELIRYTDNSTYKTTKHITATYEDKEDANGCFTELKQGGSSTVAMFVGGLAGVMSSMAMGYLLKANAPVFDSKLKNVMTGVGLGLVGSAVGSFVSKDVTETVDDMIDIVEQFRMEVAARKAVK